MFVRGPRRSLCLLEPMELELFAPAPIRLVDIVSLIQAYADEAKAAVKAVKAAKVAEAAEVAVPVCLRWSCLTFGWKELRIQHAVDAERARFLRRSA